MKKLLIVGLMVLAGSVWGQTLTSSGTVQFATDPGKLYVLGATGTFGSGTAVLQWSNDNGASYVPSGTLTASGQLVLTAPGSKARLVLSGATSPSVAVTFSQVNLPAAVANTILASGGTANNLTASGTTTVANLIVSGSAQLNGNTQLGDASGDTVTVNAGTVTAPNASGTSSTSLSNVGTLDARYGNLRIVRLTSDFTLNNVAAETTVTGWAQSDLALAASSTYVIEVNIVIAATAGGWRVQSYWDFGTGGIGTHVSSYWAGAAAAPSSVCDTRSAVNVSSFFAASGTFGGGTIRFIIRTGTGSPYIELKFRQNTADASNTSIKAGSFIAIRKIE